MPHDLLDDEVEELLGELRLELGHLGQLPQPLDLLAALLSLAHPRWLSF